MGIDPETLLLTDRNFAGSNSESDIKGSEFAKLQAKAVKNQFFLYIRQVIVSGARILDLCCAFVCLYYCANSVYFESDIKGSEFAKLQAKAVKTQTKKVTLKWKKIKGADGYLVYGVRCGKGKLKLLKNIKKSSQTTYSQTKLKKGKPYRYLIRAYKSFDDAFLCHSRHFLVT